MFEDDQEKINKTDSIENVKKEQEQHKLRKKGDPLGLRNASDAGKSAMRWGIRFYQVFNTILYLKARFCLF